MARNYSRYQILYQMLPAAGDPTKKCAVCNWTCEFHHAMIGRDHICGRCEIRLQESLTGGPRTKDELMAAAAADALKQPETPNAL